MVSPTDARRPWWRQRWSVIIGGFALAFGSGVAYAWWLKRSGDWNQGFHWESSFLIATHQPLPAWLDAMLYVAPWFGTNLVLMPVIFVAGVWLWRRVRRPDIAMHLYVVQIGSFLLNPALKAAFDRARPEIIERRGWYGWSAYPSGHAICSIAVLWTIAVILHEERGWKWPYAIILPVSLLSIYSRVYLGVHWPTDVLGGMLVGFVWLLVTVIAFRWRASPEASGISAMGGQLAQPAHVHVAAGDERRDML